MNQIIIRKNKIYFLDKEYEVNDLYSRELYTSLSKINHLLNEDVSIINEVFINRLLPFQAIVSFLKNNDIKEIRIRGADVSILPFILDAAKSLNIKVIDYTLIRNIFIPAINNTNIMLSSLYLIFKMIVLKNEKKLQNDAQNISIIRSPAAMKKMEFLREIDNIEISYESIKGKASIYEYFPLKQRLKWIFNAWKNSYSVMRLYKKSIKKLIGENSALEASIYYSKRVVHTLLYKGMLDFYFSENKNKIYYTGNMADRFALIEEELAKKHKIKLICIPHGLEYGFRLPHCFVGDEFYSTSEEAATRLNNLYNTNKFIYDVTIVSKMFKVNSESSRSQRILFFTEPREVYVNLRIIDELLQLMKKENMHLSLRLHPKDKITNYKKYDGLVEFVEDFDLSISNNICISRKSTILLEAIHNNSSAAAILINSKDAIGFNTFPSLNISTIKRFTNIPQLFEWIKSSFIY